MTKELNKINRQICSSEYALENLDLLPVAHLRNQLREEIRLHPNFVLIGETGSGKTTCLPPLLLEMRNELGLTGGIAVTQPRRIATRSVTGRVSEMMQCAVGDQIGYHIRFEDITSPETDITFMTDGILLRKIQFDPLLLDYSIVMIDEAHERSLNIDLCLGLLKDVNERRYDSGLEPIRVVITSATIERNRFAEYISYGDKNNSVEIPGKMYPVEVFYEDEIPLNYDFTKGSAEKVKYIIDNDLDGDILIFMPGKKEIADTIEKIETLLDSSDVEILPLHAELPPEDQDRIFDPSEKRKVVIATNIAETSITPPGKINVIDTGLIKQTQFDPKSGIERLVLIEHAKSGLEQRKGRAGRTAPGRCYRLFTKESFERRPQYQTPEMMRSNLCQVVLAMRKVGIKNINSFDYLDHPGDELLTWADETLTKLGSFDDNDELSEIGEWLFELAIEPHLGRMIIESLDPKINCVNEIVIIASMLDGKNLFVRPQETAQAILADKAHAQFANNNDSDFIVLLNIWKAYAASGFSDDWAKQNYLNEKVLEEAKNVRLDILDVLANHQINIDPKTKPIIRKDAIHQAITAGLVGNLIQKADKFSFRKVDGTKSNISIHPNSVYFNSSPPKGSFLIANEIFINPQGKTFACTCLEVKRDWLKDYLPEIFYRSSHRHQRQENKSGNSKHHSRHHSRH